MVAIIIILSIVLILEAWIIYVLHDTNKDFELRYKIDLKNFEYVRGESITAHNYIERIQNKYERIKLCNNRNNQMKNHYKEKYLTLKQEHEQVRDISKKTT